VHKRIEDAKDELFVKLSERLGVMEKFLAQKYDAQHPQQQPSAMYALYSVVFPVVLLGSFPCA